MTDLHVPLTAGELGYLSGRIQLDDRKVFLLERPDAFLAHYFPHKLQKFKDFHVRLIAAATMHKQALLLEPAFHGKTTIVSTTLPIWALCRDPNHRIGIILKNEDDASGVSAAVRAELEDNPDLIRDFGPFKPEKGSSKRWAVGTIECRHRNLRSPRPTVQFYGSGGNVFGHRSDWTICDDVVTDKNSNTPENRARIREWFNLGVRTMPELDDDRLTVVGTRFHPEDLYGDLLEMRDPYNDEPIWHLEYEDAIVDEDEETTLWPERWSYRSLMMLKAELGTLDFNKRLRNKAVDPARMVFKEEYVKGGYVGAEKFPGCLDRQHTVGDMSNVDFTYLGFDPARAKRVRKGSFQVLMTLGAGSCEEHERCYWIIDMLRDTMSAPRQADLILETYAEMDASACRIETNAYQEGLKEIIEERMDQRQIRYKIEPHHTGNNKLDPEIGVQAMGPYVERGEFHIPYGDAHSRAKMKPLIEELVEYPGRMTDCVMGLWIAWLCAKDMAPRYISFSRVTKPLKVGRAVLTGRQMIQNPYYDRDEG